MRAWGFWSTHSAPLRIARATGSDFQSGSSVSRSSQTVPIRDGVARFGSLEQVGVHKLLGPEGRQERLAVNLASDAESELAVVPHQAVGVGGEVILASAPGRTPLTRAFLALVAFVLLMEWWLYQRKYRE